MLSFFRRKKPQDAPAAEAPKTQHYSAEELAAAFPSAAPVEDKEPAPAAVAAEPAPVESPPAAVVPVAVEPTPVIPAPAAPVPAAPAPTAQIDVAPIATPAIEPAPAPLPGPTPAPAPVTDDLPAAASVDAVPATAGKPGWRERLRNSVIARSFGGLFSRNPKLDDDLLDELETALITADVGVGATTDLVEGLRKRMKSREFADANALLAALRAELIAILQPVAKPLVIDRTAKPFVVLTVGVNGVGKTTTIGKLASRFAEKHAPRDVALVTTDTTRIGAREQLYGYGRQLGIAVHEANSGTDLDQLLERLKDYKLVLIDTAGLGPRDRALAAQLQWLRAARQVRTLLVLPANTSFGDMDEVVRRFGAANLQGLVLSKLDETGRFGNALSVAVDHALPITWVTDGQDVPEDLHRASAANLVLRLEDLRRAADMPCNPELNHAVA